jgi:hypothetical protein
MMMENGVKVDVEQIKALQIICKEDNDEIARKAYHTAMTAFKADPPKIIKDLQNGQYNSKYASLGNVTGTISAELSKHALSASWLTDQKENGWPVVTCVIVHSQGHKESTSLSAPPDDSGSKNPIQRILSTVTYLKRDTLLSLTGLATYDQDDDGNGAGNNNAPPKIKPPTEANLEVVDLIIAEMPPANQGMMYDRKKVAMFFLREKGRYPADPNMVVPASEVLMQKNPQNIYSPVESQEPPSEDDYHFEPEN